MNNSGIKACCDQMMNVVVDHPHPPSRFGNIVTEIENPRHDYFVYQRWIIQLDDVLLETALLGPSLSVKEMKFKKTVVPKRLG